MKNWCVILFFSIFLIGCSDPFKEEILIEIESIKSEAERLQEMYRSDTSRKSRHRLLVEYRDLAARIIAAEESISSKYEGKEKSELWHPIFMLKNQNSVVSNLQSVESFEADKIKKACFKKCKKDYQPCWEKCGCKGNVSTTHIRWKTHTYYGSGHPLSGISLNEYPDICRGEAARKCRSKNCLLFHEYEKCHISCVRQSGEEARVFSYRLQ
jgi:hypothetical protein